MIAFEFGLYYMYIITAVLYTHIHANKKNVYNLTTDPQ